MDLLAEVKREIRARSDRFEQFFAAGDAAGLVADYYVDDPIMSAPDMELLRGRAAIETLFAAIMKDVATCRLEQVEVRVDRDLAYEVSRAYLGMKDPSAPQAACRYVINWRRTADGWRVESDFFAYGVL
jgi:ketosteroid isomerase-like protein